MDPRHRGARFTALLVAALLATACDSTTPSPRPSVGIAVASQAPSARASAMPEPTPIPSSTPSPPLGLWRPVLSQTLVSPGIAGIDPNGEQSVAVIHDAVAFRGGLIAVGSDAGGAAVWQSPDGATWTRSPDDPTLDGQAMDRVATNGTRLVAAGSTVWESTDGVSWGIDRSSAFGAAPGLFTEIHGVAHGRAGFVVLGIKDEMLGCEGCKPTPPTSWRSTDGVTWRSRTQSFAQLAGATHGGDLEMLDIAATETGYVAVGGGIWTSSDGLSWARVGSPPAGVVLDRVASAGSAIVASGATDNNEPVSMVSTDSRHWKTVTTDNHGAIRDVLKTDVGYLAVGRVDVPPSTPEGDDGTTHPWFWESTDGEHWRSMVDASEDGGGSIDRVVRFGARTVALGSVIAPPDMTLAGVWIQAPFSTASIEPQSAPESVGTWSTIGGVTIPPTVGPTEGPGSIIPVLIGDRVLIIYAGGRGTAAVWIDPSTGAAQIGGVTKAIHTAPAVSRDGETIYVVGGGSTDVRRVDRFDTVTGRWLAPQRLPVATDGVFVAAFPDGRVLDLPDDDPLRYRIVDPVGLRVGPARSVPFETLEAMAVAGSGVIAVTSYRVWRFDDATGHWLPGTRLPRIGGGVHAATLPDGRVAMIRAGGDSDPWLDVIGTDGNSMTERPVDSPDQTLLWDSTLVAIGPSTLLVIVPQDTCADGDCEVNGTLSLYRLDLGGI